MDLREQATRRLLTDFPTLALAFTSYRRDGVFAEVGRRVSCSTIENTTKRAWLGYEWLTDSPYLDIRQIDRQYRDI